MTFWDFLLYISSYIELRSSKTIVSEWCFSNSYIFLHKQSCFGYIKTRRIHIRWRLFYFISMLYIGGYTSFFSKVRQYMVKYALSFFSSTSWKQNISIPTSLNSNGRSRGIEVLSAQTINPSPKFSSVLIAGKTFIMTHSRPETYRNTNGSLFLYFSFQVI